MASRYITTDNSRGSTVTASNPTYAHIRGWNAGVRVEASNKDGTAWVVYMTSGSDGNGRNVLLGTVHASPDGPHFVTAEDEMSADAMEYQNRSHP